MKIRTFFNFAQNALSTIVFLFTLPIVLPWRLLKSFFVLRERQKPWRRVIGDAVFRWIISTQTIPYIAFLVGPSSRTYETWCRKNSLEPCIEAIEGGAQLFWMGNKRTHRVILYLHGGGFSLPMGDYSVKFWRYVQSRLQDSGIEVSIAILDYTLIPDAHFPTPLRQTVATVNHLMSSGIQPENIQITGDSAGANLVLQLLLHMLHPLDGIPSLAPGTQFRGAYLMSPWVFMTPRDGVKSYTENAGLDVVASKKTYADFAARVFATVAEESDLPYIDASFAPTGWYANVEKMVGRVLITAGGLECIRDDIVEFANIFCKAHAGAELVVDKFGVHDDPFNDFMVGEKKLAELTPLIVQWFLEGFWKK